MLGRLFGSSKKKPGVSASTADADDIKDTSTSRSDVSAASEVDRELDPAVEARYHSEIEHYLRKEKSKMQEMITVLLIGPGESGKSTFMKQIARIHAGKMSGDQLRIHAENIRQNIIEGMVVLCEQSRMLGGDCSVSEELEALMDDVIGLERGIGEGFLSRIDEAMISTLHSLWSDPGIQATFARRHEFKIRQVPYHLGYLMGRSSEVWSADYTPTYEDYLMVRVRTTGINEEMWWSTPGDSTGDSSSSSKSTRKGGIRSIPFKFVDVGGQRSERRKWMRVFDARAALYVLGLGDYDLKCFEDGKTGRLDEALILFDTLNANVFDKASHSRFFDGKSLIIFFNKWDVLVDKLASSERPFGDAVQNFPKILARRTSSKKKKSHSSGSSETSSSSSSETTTVTVDLTFDRRRESNEQYIFEYMRRVFDAVIEKHKPKTLGDGVHYHQTLAISVKSAQRVIRTVQSDLVSHLLSEAGFV